MTAFPGPFNYLELMHLQSIDIYPKSWDFGEFSFQVDNRTKTVSGTRIFLHEQIGEKRYKGLPYIDVGQQRLLYDLRPLLATVIPGAHGFRVTAYGTRPHTTYSVQPLLVQ